MPNGVLEPQRMSTMKRFFSSPIGNALFGVFLLALAVYSFVTFDGTASCGGEVMTDDTVCVTSRGGEVVEERDLDEQLEFERTGPYWLAGAGLVMVAIGLGRVVFGGRRPEPRQAKPDPARAMASALLRAQERGQQHR